MKGNQQKIQDWFECAGPAEQRGKNTEEGLQEYARQVCKYLAPAERADILDLGCGDGEVTCHVAQRLGAHVTGVDFASDLLRKAREKYRDINWIIATPVKGLPFKDKTFDKIYSIGFLQYITPNAYEPMMREVHRVLKDDGLLVHVAVPDKRNFWKHRKGRILSRNFFLSFYDIADFFTNSFTRKDGSRWWSYKEASRLVQTYFNVKRFDYEEGWYRMDLVYQKKV